MDTNVTYKIAEDDLDVKRGTVLKSTVIKPSSFLEVSRLEHISNWKSARRAIALCIELKALIQPECLARVASWLKMATTKAN